MIPQFEEIRLQALRELSSGAVMKPRNYEILWLNIFN